MNWLTDEEIDDLLDEDFSEETAEAADDRERRNYKRDMETWIQSGGSRR